MNKTLSIIIVLTVLAVQQTFAQTAPTFTKPDLKIAFTKATRAPVKLPAEPRSFWRPYGPATWLSTGVCAAGAVADMRSSRGGYELNPLMRNAQGGVAVDRAVIASGLACSAAFLFERKAPKLAHAWRLIIGGVRLGIAVRNFKTRTR